MEQNNELTFTELILTMDGAVEEVRTGRGSYEVRLGVISAQVINYQDLEGIKWLVTVGWSGNNDYEINSEVAGVVKSCFPEPRRFASLADAMRAARGLVRSTARGVMDWYSHTVYSVICFGKLMNAPIHFNSEVTSWGVGQSALKTVRKVYAWSIQTLFVQPTLDY